MADLNLSVISNYNERVEPLMNGTIKADGGRLEELFAKETLAL